MHDLFSDTINQDQTSPIVIHHGQGLVQIKHLAPSQLCLFHIQKISQYSPFRKMMTPMGHPMQAMTTNCGIYGWISDNKGYHYSEIDPEINKRWTTIPAEFLQLHKYACELANIPLFDPDACLINQYQTGQGMGLHQDKDEMDRNSPIISISLGLNAIFQVGGKSRKDPIKEYLLEDGDVIILSNESRHFYHGIKPIKPNPLSPNCLFRYNLTLRKSH